MLLSPKLPLAEVEAEENEVEEEEVEGLLIQRIEPVMHNIHITQSTLTTLKVRGEEERDGPINIQCNHFKKCGYYERECKKKQAYQNNGRANVSKEEEGLLEVMLTSYQATEEHCNSYLRILDSDCSNHMRSNKSLFSSLDSSGVTNIKLGNDFLDPAKGKGIVPIFTKQN